MCVGGCVGGCVHEDSDHGLVVSKSVVGPSNSGVMLSSWPVLVPLSIVPAC